MKRTVRVMTKIVGDGLRVAVDDSCCIVIERDRINPPRVETFTVTNADALIAGLRDAQDVVRHYEGRS